MNKNTKYLFGFLFIVLIILLVSQHYLILHTPKTTEEQILEKLNEIESKINVISEKKDSIRVVIRTIDKEIYTNEKHYEERVTNAITQSTYLDSVFITNYVDRFIENEGINIDLFTTRDVEH